jgi:hypothetical protein
MSIRRGLDVIAAGRCTGQRFFGMVVVANYGTDTDDGQRFFGMVVVASYGTDTDDGQIFFGMVVVANYGTDTDDGQRFLLRCGPARWFGH